MFLTHSIFYSVIIIWKVETQITKKCIDYLNINFKKQMMFDWGTWHGIWKIATKVGDGIFDVRFWSILMKATMFQNCNWEWGMWFGKWYK
jgi:hypothetical protein